jgi:uncharacterized protein YkwD
MNRATSGDWGVRILAAWVAIVVGCAWSPLRPDPQSSRDRSFRSRKTIPEPVLESLRTQVVEAHNRIRSEAKLNTLEVSEKLQAAAQAHARDMAARLKMTHQGSKGSTPIDRIKAQGYPYLRAGENIAVGQFTVDRLMKTWMDSPHHKRNILGGFSQIGVGCATGEDGKRYWCVTFGLPIRR